MESMVKTQERMFVFKNERIPAGFSIDLVRSKLRGQFSSRPGKARVVLDYSPLGSSISNRVYFSSRGILIRCDSIEKAKQLKAKALFDLDLEDVRFGLSSVRYSFSIGKRIDLLKFQSVLGINAFSKVKVGSMSNVSVRISLPLFGDLTLLFRPTSVIVQKIRDPNAEQALLSYLNDLFAKPDFAACLTESRSDSIVKEASVYI